MHGGLHTSLEVQLLPFTLSIHDRRIKHSMPQSDCNDAVFQTFDGAQEELEEFVMDNWAPALQATFGDQWREHLQAELSASEFRAAGNEASTSGHAFDSLLPKPLEEPGHGVPEAAFLEEGPSSSQDPQHRARTFEARSMEVQHICCLQLHDTTVGLRLRQSSLHLSATHVGSTQVCCIFNLNV